MRTLIYCPEAGITPFYSAMTVVGHSLRSRGHRVFTSFCTGTFRRCVIKLGIPRSLTGDDHQQLCTNCRSQVLPYAVGLDLSLLPLESYAEPNMDAAIDTLIADWQGDILDFTFEGQKLGKCAEFDLCLGFKTYANRDMAGEERAYFIDALHTVIKTYILAKRLIGHAAIEKVIVYNQYGPSMAVVLAAAACGATTKFMANSSHAGVDRGVVWFTSLGPRHFYLGLARDWDKWSRIPLTPDGVKLVSDDIKARFLSGSVHVYSPGKNFDLPDIRTAIGLRSDRKTIVAFTSSPDELYAQYAADEVLGIDVSEPTLAFADQAAWMGDLKRLAAERDDLQVCVRIHPREAPNRRDNVRSQHLEKLEAALIDLPENMKVIWPQDPVSSYDLLDGADLVMTAWSTMGLESARLGIPVLSVFQPLVGCPVGDFIKVPTSREDYRVQLEEMLDAPADFYDIRQAFRWYHITKFAAAVSVADAFPSQDTQTIAKVLDNAATIEGILEQSEPEEQRRLAAALATPPSQADWDAEVAAVRAELHRVIVYFMTGTWSDRDVRMSWGDPSEKEPSTEDHAVLDRRDGRCVLAMGGLVFEKRSRVVERLGTLLFG